MDPHRQFCHNPACPARGQVDQGNIVIHSQQEQRYRCTLCRHTFTARRGTPYYRGHVPAADIHTLLETRPQAIGLAVPGMPLGAPGMEQGTRRNPYSVLLFKSDGTVSEFQKYTEK